VTEDEEKQLKQELLVVDLSLRRKQEFWETPRNLAILVGVTAAIAAAIGFWLGRQSPAPPAPTIGPAAIGDFDSMHNGAFVDAVQTAGILVMAAVLVYVALRLDRTLTTAAKKLKTALGNQKALQEGIERVWARVDLIENLQGTQKTFIPTIELKAMLDEIRHRLDQLEAKNENPSIDH
jgi:hypothetical protein